VKLPRVHRVTKPGGAVHKYHRRTRAPLPSDIPEDHPDFIAAWTAEEARKPVPKSPHAEGTIGAGCVAYLASASFAGLGTSYRAVIRRHVEAIRLAGGQGRMADLRPRHIEANIETLLPSVAQARMKAWRKLGAFWRVQGWVTADPAGSVRSQRLPATPGHPEWQPEDVERFRAHWPAGSPQRLAFELLQWTGARASDAVRLGPGMVRANGLMVFRQSKTGVEAMVPWTHAPADLEWQRQHLVTSLAQTTKGLVFIRTASGKPRSIKAFSSWFSGAASAAGLGDLAAHGLRKYRMNQLAEFGAGVLMMQAWVGHTTLSEVERYTRRAQRAKAVLGTEQKQNPVNPDRRRRN